MSAPFARAIEPLESRIAPANVILAGDPNPNINDVNYTDTIPADDAYFIDTEQGILAGDMISMQIGAGDPGADTFYLKMGPGDVLKVFTTTNGFSDTFIKVRSGNIVVFLQDKDFDNEVDTDEIVGLSLGKNVNIDVRNGVPGDIVTNLNERGTKSTLDDDLDLAGLVSTKQGIAQMIISSSTGGSILSGGNINNVRVFGGVTNVLAGSAANGAVYDLFPGIAGGEGAVAFVTPDGVAGANINRVILDDVIGRVEAGSGGAGAKGGTISLLQITEDTDGFTVLAGKGGDANAVKKKGGAGGAINGLYIAGIDDGTPNDDVIVAAGAGGLGSATANGGVGGSLTSIFVGYSIVGNRVIASDSLLQDDVRLFAGKGGDGRVAGAGGGVSRTDVNVSTPEGFILGENEVEVRAGDGGAALAVIGGKAGNGGTIFGSFIRNETLIQPLNLDHSDVSVFAGNGGLGTLTAPGGKGGSLLGTKLRGIDVIALAGDGGDGKKGGAGGTLTNVTAEEAEGIILRTGNFEGGNGGAGLAGAAGNGGTIFTLRVNNSDISGNLNVLAGNGGDSVGGRGGAGGSIFGLDVLDGDIFLGNQGAALVVAGEGGDGTKGGAPGGSLQNTNLLVQDMDITLRAGNGGSAAGVGASGKGGAGGTIFKTSGSAIGDLFVNLPPFPNATLTSGNGGNGAGAKAIGGAAGDIRLTALKASGSASLISGTGGDGANAAPGRGGSIFSTLVFADNGDGLFRAGNGGANGVGPARGGSIFGFSNDLLSGLFSSLSLTLEAGDGTHGGAGGSLKFIGWGSTTSNVNLTPTPIGNINILAGDGSGEGKFAGAGGSIDNVQGAVASADIFNPGPFNTVVAAGIGGASPTKSAPGGSLTNLDIRRGGNAGGVFTLKAGDAGNSPGALIGANGGKVRIVQVAEIDATNIFRTIAAGDGAPGLKKGGKGGSVEAIDVLDHDIGVRFGETYGFDTMGGIFAGAGGTGPLRGLAGNVDGIRAQMVAAIVAGRGAAPEEVEKVSRIYVGLPTDLLKASDNDLDFFEFGGDPNFYAYTANYFTNTFVGAVVDPTRVDANKFLWTDDGDGVYELGEVPTDGLIVAKKYDQKTTNFVPEARVVAGALFDSDNIF